MTGHWFVRSVADGETHRAHTEHWTADGRAEIRPACDPAAKFTAINREPIAVPYFDDQCCSRCLIAAQAAARPQLLVVVR